MATKKITKKTAAKKSSPKMDIEGTRVQFPDDAFSDMPNMTFNRDAETTNVQGLGSTGYLGSISKAHRRGVRILGKALVIEPAGMTTVYKLIRNLGLRGSSPATMLVNNSRLKQMVSNNNKMRWATEAETAAFIKKERAFRQKCLARVLKKLDDDFTAAQRQLKRMEAQVVSAKRALEKARSATIAASPYRTRVVNVGAEPLI